MSTPVTGSKRSARGCADELGVTAAVKAAEGILNESWSLHAERLKMQRNKADRHVIELKAENEVLRKAVTSGEELTRATFARQVDKAIARRTALKDLEDALAAEREAERDAPSDVTIRFRGKPDLVRSEEEPLPPGVRIYRRAVPLAVIEQLLPELEQRVAEDRKSRPITAGQSDRKRTQLKVDASEEIGLALLKALHRCGELHGRNHREVNVIQSQPACKTQELHWDYDPDLVRNLRRRARRGRKVVKPASAMLALQTGTCLHVRDERRNQTVTVPIGPGDLLMFDGDVAHHGAAYASLNTRVHMYLDVDGVEREADVTWFPDPARAKL